MYISVTSWRNLLRTRAVGNSSEHGEFIPRPSFMFAKGKLFFYLLEGMFLAGVFVGTMLISHAEEETLQMLQTVLGGYVGQRQIQSFSSIALSTFVSLFSSLLVLFFCGLCTIAQPIVFLALLFKGLGYGFSLGMLYAQYGNAAVPYAFILLKPTIYFGALLLIAAGKVSVRMSIHLFRSTLPNGEKTELNRMKRYCIKFILFAAICGMIALVDALLCYKLGGLFLF